MAEPVIQTAFSAGELSPNLFARVDLDKYHVGAALLENFFVDYHGGVLNRPGTAFVGKSAADGTIRLIPFIYSASQAYVIEIGYASAGAGLTYARIIYNGGYVLETAKVITGVSLSSTCTVTSNAHGFNNGDWVYITGIVGTTQLNGRTFITSGVTANTFALIDIFTNVQVDSTTYTAYVSGGTAARLLTLVFFAGADVVDTINYTQSGDVLTLSSLSLPQPYNITRVSATSWTVTAVALGSTMTAPTGLAVATNGGDTLTKFQYQVTSVNLVGDESLPGTASDDNLTALSATVSNRLTWSAATSASYYNIYRRPWAAARATAQTGMLFGLIGSTKGLIFVDRNLEADYSITPPVEPAFGSATTFANYGGAQCSAYFQQRRVFANLAGLVLSPAPQTLFFSRTGLPNNYNNSIPTQDIDRIEVSLNSLQVNAIQSLVPMPGGLVALTSGGLWQISGDGPTAPITPSSIIGTPQGYDGASALQPVIINTDIIFEQLLGSSVRSAQFNFGTSMYQTEEISVLANHLFADHTILNWAYAAEPWRTVWAVRDDGVMLSLAYYREQQVTAWAHHETDGTYLAVASIPEGTESALYVAVRRSINGATVQYIERAASRVVSTINDAWFVDCGLRYSGAAATVISGLTHLNGEEVTILADGAVLPNQIVFNGTVTLAAAATNVLVGLAYTSKLKSLRLDLGNPTVQTKRKKQNALTVRALTTRGLQVGTDFDHLVEIKQRSREAYGTPITITTEDSTDLRAILDLSWNEEGQLAVQQAYPLPAQILGLIPEVWIGDT